MMVVVMSNCNWIMPVLYYDLFSIAELTGKKLGYSHASYVQSYWR